MARIHPKDLGFRTALTLSREKVTEIGFLQRNMLNVRQRGELPGAELTTVINAELLHGALSSVQNSGLLSNQKVRLAVDTIFVKEVISKAQMIITYISIRTKKCVGR